MKRKAFTRIVVALLLLTSAPFVGASMAVAASEASEEASMPVSQSDPEKVKTWGEKDPYGVSMSLLAMSIVFVSLLVLYVLFRAIGKSMGREREVPATAPENGLSEAETTPAAATAPQQQSDEVAAAIALAIQQALYLHDEESGIITLKPHASAWNIKNYTPLNEP